MNVTLQYFDGCPNWLIARERLEQALALSGPVKIDIELHRIDSPEEAERCRFPGSPTMVIDGRDLFATQSVPGGLACRLYDGPGGVPSVAQMVSALGA